MLSEVGKIGNFRIYTNGSGEVFVELKDGPTLRISDISHNRMTVITSGSIIQPTSVNGLDAFRVTKI